MAITQNNVQNVKFLRNGSVFTPSIDPVKTARQVALDAMELQKANLADGTAILGRYQETNGIVKTLVGFAYVNGETKTLTVFDVDGAGADVDEKIKAAIEALDAEKTSSDGTNVQVKVTEVDGKITAVNITTDNTVNSGDVATAIENAINDLDGSVIAETGHFVKSVTEADGKISGTTEALPTVAAISVLGKPITAVSESLGAISATAGTINAEFVNIADSGEKFTATTVEDALAEIATEIDAMDLAVVSGDGEVITAVSEDDGKVSASKTAIKDVKLTGYVKDTTKTGAISATDDVEDALSKLENTIGSNAISNDDGSITVTPANGSTTDVKVHIKSGEKVIKLDDNGGGIYTNLNLVEITGETLPAEIKVRYELRDSDNVKIGESIDIPKDSHIVSINYITGGTHAQNLEYVYVDVSGETKTTYVDMSALVLEAEFESGVTVDAGSHIVHGVVDPTSENFLTVGADGFKLDGVQNAIDTAISGLDVSDSAVAGQYVSQVSETDGKIAVVRANVSEAVLNNYSKGSASGAVASTDTVNEAISKIEVRLDGELAALDATVSGETSDGKVNVKVTETDGKITAVDVVGTDIASASALTAETAARKAVDGQNGDTYAANTNANYISGATSLNDADVKLDAALKALSDETVNQVKVNNVALTETANAVNVQISSVAASGTDSSPIVVNTDNSTGAVTLQILQIDCGEY